MALGVLTSLVVTSSLVDLRGICFGESVASTQIQDHRGVFAEVGDGFNLCFSADLKSDLMPPTKTLTASSAPCTQSAIPLTANNYKNETITERIESQTNNSAGEEWIIGAVAEGEHLQAFVDVEVGDQNMEQTYIEGMQSMSQEQQQDEEHEVEIDEEEEDRQCDLVAFQNISAPTIVISDINAFTVESTTIQVLLQRFVCIPCYRWLSNYCA